MKKIVSFVAATVIAAATFAQTTYTAKKDFTLTFSGSEGTNGTAVVWNPDKQVYYAAIAGNAVYPLETFGSGGNLKYANTTEIDVRGLWYNAKTKKLEGNGAGEVGYFSYMMNASGEPRTPEVTLSGQHQPDFQSVAAFDGKKLYFFFDGKITSYSTKGKAGKSLALKNSPASVDVLNATTVVYTGRKGEEFGLLDYDAKRVYLFNKKGVYTATVNLPGSAITGNMFRFAFANGKIWLYDVDSRSWTGYTF
ncbi:MAG: hypothetical protein AB7G44_10680 [Bacteroidia bacterium]